MSPCSSESSQIRIHSFHDGETWTGESVNGGSIISLPTRAQLKGNE
jgi:hypothetical protein